MTRLWYFVLRHQGQWMISFRYTNYGPYATQQQAIATAIDWAQQHGLEGYDTQVVIQDEHQFTTVWTYGRDRYPPDFRAKPC
jgi:hypothetical protein